MNGMIFRSNLAIYPLKNKASMPILIFLFIIYSLPVVSGETTPLLDKPDDPFGVTGFNTVNNPGSTVQLKAERQRLQDAIRPLEAQRRELQEEYDAKDNLLTRGMAGLQRYNRITREIEDVAQQKLLSKSEREGKIRELEKEKSAALTQIRGIDAEDTADLFAKLRKEIRSLKSKIAAKDNQIDALNTQMAALHKQKSEKGGLLKD